MSKTLQFFLCYLLLSLTFSSQAQVGLAQTTNETSESLIKIENIDFQGNTIFDNEELKKIILSVKGQEITLEELLQVRAKITQYYVDQGYINSAAFIPPQELSNGQITIQIIEGTIEKIEVDSQGVLNSRYVLSRLPKENTILNKNSLLRTLEKLQNDLLIENVSAELSQIELGKAKLALNVNAQPRFTSQLILANSFSPSIGRYGGQADFQFQVFGYGDLLNFTWAKTKGSDRYLGAYSFLINQYDTSLTFSYTKAISRLVEESLSALDIEGDFNSYQIALRHPIVLSRSQKLNLGVEFSLIRSESFILDDFSFSFVDGLEDGKSRISELSLVQEYIKRSTNSIFQLKSAFNLGLRIFDSTITEQGRDGLYWNWQAKGELSQKLANNIFLISGFGVQLSPDQLLPIKQFSLGGINSVRGYRQNLLVGDNGLVLSSELQFSVMQSESSELKIISFLEGGKVGNNKQDDDAENLLAIGLGLQYSLRDSLNIRIDYGIPLIDINELEQSSLRSASRTTFSVIFSP